MPDHTAHPSIEELREAFHAQLSSASTDQALKGLNDTFLSRKSGSVTALLKSLGTMQPEQRREFGQLVNTLKAEIESALDAKRVSIEATRQPAGAVDVTLPARAMPAGSSCSIRLRYF